MNGAARRSVRVAPDRQLDERLAGGASETGRQGRPAGERGDQLPWLHARDGAAAHDPCGAEVARLLDAARIAAQPVAQDVDEDGVESRAARESRP